MISLLPLVMLVGLIGAPETELEARCQAAESYNNTHSGHALLVLYDGRIVHETYHAGWTAEKPHGIASGTKSFWGPLAAAAVDDGLLTLDERAAETLTAWRDDPRKSRITLRMLLSFSSGLEPNVVTSLDEVNRTDVYAAATAVEAVADPGTTWSYGPTHHSVFAEILRRNWRRGESVRAYLDRRLLEPLDIRIATWQTDHAGQPLTSSGVELTARDWAKWGEFIRLGGVTSQGRRLISEAALAECFKGGAFPLYGLGWWLGAFEAELPDDFKMAAGAGKQQLYVIPSQRLTIVRFGEEAGYTNADFLQLILAAQRP